MVVFVLALVWAAVNFGKKIVSWRLRIRMQTSMLDEKEKEIQELKELWNVDPSVLEWDELLARYITTVISSLLFLSFNVDYYLIKRIL